MKKLLLTCSLALAGLGSAALASAPPASSWEIGPIIDGRNYSVGMPLRPAPAEGSVWSFDFPYSSVADGHVHYVTFDPGSLSGKSRIVYRYRVDAARGARFVPQEHTDMAGTVSLVLQRQGDNWRARGPYEFYRWYAPEHTVREITPGVHEVSIDLNDPAWISVNGRQSHTNPRGFQAALADTNRIGLVFGSYAARGHGVYATAPARFELLTFRVE